jgi:aspartate racemase
MRLAVSPYHRHAHYTQRQKNCDTMTKQIGIVAVSAEGAALCYRTICAEGAALFGRHAHPEVTMHTYPLADYMRHSEAGRWDEVGEMLLASAEKLRTVGADLLI